MDWRKSLHDETLLSILRALVDIERVEEGSRVAEAEVSATWGADATGRR